MCEKKELVHTLNDVGLFTRSKIAELAGLRVYQVYQILKEDPKHITDCENGGCPCPLLCEAEGCQPDE